MRNIKINQYDNNYTDSEYCSKDDEYSDDDTIHKISVLNETGILFIL